MNNVLIIGASGHGKVILEILELSGNASILGFIDSNLKQGTKIYNYSVLGDMDVLFEMHNSNPDIGGIIAVGDNWNRKLIADDISGKIPNFGFVNAIHPAAVVSKYSEIGKGVVVVANSTINPGAKVGNHCIINTKSSVGHDVTLDDYCSIAPGVTLGGNVKVGELTAISLGSVVRNNVMIGRNTVVGASSYVHTNLDNNVLAYGTPAKVICQRIWGEPYL